MPSSSVVAEPFTPPFSLTGDRYDQSTYWGRFRKMLDQCDPTTLLHSTKEIYEARNAMHDYYNGESKLSDEELWQARKLKESAVEPRITRVVGRYLSRSGCKCSSSAYVRSHLVKGGGSGKSAVSAFVRWPTVRYQPLRTSTVMTIRRQIHPDTGDLIPQPFRMSGYVPFNGPVCVGAVMAKSTPAIVFWHWVNQSQNAFVNYFNRNASSPVDDETLTWSYLGAVTSAIAIAYGLSTVVKKRLPPAKATVVLRWVGLPASMVASSANCFIMRHSELDTGITVFKKGTNEEVGTSQAAAKKALKEVVASRVLLQFPVFGVSPAFMTLPPVQRLCLAYPSLALPISTTEFAARGHGFSFPTAMRIEGLIVQVLLLSFGLGLPGSIAAFPQTGVIPENSLEPELRGHGDLQYNKGL